jgi:enoyl-[acyl-carrier protein] reductase I
MQGYLAAMSASSYSFVSMVQRFAPLMNAGGAAINLTYVASNRVIPGYGGGMSSAKAVSDDKCVRYTSSCFKHRALVTVVGMKCWGF